MKKAMTPRGLLVLFLVVAIHASGITAEVCLCGQSCSHVLQEDALKEKADPFFHKRCPGSVCKGCNLEKGQTLKAVTISSSDIDFKASDAPWIASAFADAGSHYRVLNEIAHAHAAAAFPSFPIHLRNLSLLL